MRVAEPILNKKVVNTPKALSLYEFGAHEKVVRHIQAQSVKYFRGASPVLDIGCGRGIFLQLLAEARIDAVGIDPSDEAAAYCRGKGFQVYQEEARTFLSGTPQQFGGIFCSHVIEHLPYEGAMELLSLCSRALRPGGILLLVTPNSLDLATMSETFWLDPTHVRPYPTLLLKRMLASCGLNPVLDRKFMGHWSLINWKYAVGHFVRKALLGRYYGKPNAMVLARKIG